MVTIDVEHLLQEAQAVIQIIRRQKESIVLYTGLHSVILRFVRSGTRTKKLGALTFLIATLKSQSNGPYSDWYTAWPLMGGLLHLVQRGGDWAGSQPDLSDD